MTRTRTQDLTTPPPETAAVIVDRLAAHFEGVRLGTLPVRAPGPGEVLVRMAAAAVNFPDILMTQGAYQLKPDLPFVPGLEGAGHVAAVGDGVTAFKTGDPVVVGLRHGAMAQYVTVPESGLRAKPSSLTMEQTAAYSAAYLTAYVALVRRGELQAGEVLLVHGATGGVGLAAVDLGRHLGARVIATGGSDEKLEIVRASGADHCLNYTLEDGRLGGFKDEVKALTDGRGADVIYDPVGGDVFDESLRCIAWGGRLLVIGFASGRIPTVGANIPLIKGFSVVGVRAGEYGRRDPAKGQDNIRQIDEWAAEGLLHPRVHATYPLEKAVEAMAVLTQRRTVGKIVVTMPS